MRRKLLGEGRYLVGARDGAQRRKGGKYLERENISFLEEKEKEENTGRGKTSYLWREFAN